LTDLLEQLEKGTPNHTIEGGELNLGANALPALKRDSGDRNRTSPFAFTGNKFEFRAVGSTASVAWPNTVINTIVSESLDFIAEEFDRIAGENPSSTDRDQAMKKILAKMITAHKAVIFNGDGYTKEWEAEAKERGLANLRSTPDALPVLLEERVLAMFDRFGVLSNAELTSRVEIFSEKYATQMRIEAEQMVVIARTMILPAVYKHQRNLAETIASTEGAGVDCSDLREELELFVALVSRFGELTKVLRHASVPDGLDSMEICRFFRDSVMPMMEAIRVVGDELEAWVESELWPMPTYSDLLTIR
ncbi:MAG: hypothetical protein JKY96_04680, partial [Phycisphaerales bacterium]|nr:hypothetical protein [Phycisphaerales bacterium]